MPYIYISMKGTALTANVGRTIDRHQTPFRPAPLRTRSHVTPRLSPYENNYYCEAEANKRKQINPGSADDDSNDPDSNDPDSDVEDVAGNAATGRLVELMKAIY